MKEYVSRYIDRIEVLARERREKLELLLIGGLAMAFYGLPRYTVDHCCPK